VENFWKPLQWNVYTFHGDQRLQPLICCYLNSWFASCMINSCVATFSFWAMAASISNLKFMYILLIRSSQFMYIVTAASTWCLLKKILFDKLLYHNRHFNMSYNYNFLSYMWLLIAVSDSIWKYIILFFNCNILGRLHAVIYKSFKNKECCIIHQHKPPASCERAFSSTFCQI
jgi:hypothetical protein